MTSRKRGHRWKPWKRRYRVGPPLPSGEGSLRDRRADAAYQAIGLNAWSPAYTAFGRTLTRPGAWTAAGIIEGVMLGARREGS